jgi:hypothetical protein
VSSLGSTYRKNPSPLALTARPKGLTNIEISCLPTGSRSVRQATFVWFERTTLQLALFTVTCMDWGSPEKPVPIIWTRRLMSPSKRRKTFEKPNYLWERSLQVRDLTVSNAYSLSSSPHKIYYTNISQLYLL